MPEPSGQGVAIVARRRAAIVCDSNPRPGTDYLVELRQGGHCTSVEGNSLQISLCMTYVPDRVILSLTGLRSYLEVVGGITWTSLEALAGAILDDLNNQLICRWLSMRLSADGHAVLAEDRQPNWRNEPLERAGASALQRTA